MKGLAEYRDAATIRSLTERIECATTRSWNLMEVCGGQTHSILRFGLDQLLPDGVRLIHGPGCPVCVTPLEQIDRALRLAASDEVTFCSFGDMLRVPGTRSDLLAVKARGGDIRAVYSPLDAVRIAQRNPTRQVAFFAVGFETTAPANAMAVLQAERLGLQNFSMLVSHVLVPPALELILGTPGNRVNGVLAAGHVCAIMGEQEYEPIAQRRTTPIVVTGFEPVDLLRGVLRCIEMLEAGEYGVVNEYRRMVRPEGNAPAIDVVRRVFKVCDRQWRGVGRIPRSGLRLADRYAAFDAEQRFGLEAVTAVEPTACCAGQVLQGLIRPNECPEFGRGCTPEHPLGAPMVSGEGACAAYYRYRSPSLMPTAETSHA